MARRIGWTAGAMALVAVVTACSGSDKNTDVTTTTKAVTTTTAVGTSTTGTGTEATTTTSPGQQDTTTSVVEESTTIPPTPSVSIDPEVSGDTVSDTEPPETDPPAQAELPGDGPAKVGGVDLPSGKVLVAQDQRLAWITDEAVPGAAAVWKKLFDAYPQTGLYPVLLYDDDQPAHWEEDSFFPNQPGNIKDLKYEDVLAHAAEPGQYVDNPPAFDGTLAPASSGTADTAAADAAVAALPDTRILLVESPDGPSSLSYMGWTGNATYDDREPLVVAVQSWAERYGAYVVAIGPNSLRLAIANPPATSGEAATLSLELQLLDPDLTTGSAPIPVIGLGDALVGQHLWTLWWAG